MNDTLQDRAVICMGTEVRQQTAYGVFVILHFTTLAAGKGNVGVLGQLLDQ